jgi:glycerophosphoryl diester phosphodiesterase
MLTIARLSALAVLFSVGAGLGTAPPSAAFLIAHRGASAYAPEHTLDAYRLAIEQGADYIEPDLCITKDHVLVVSHDPTLERTTNVEEVFPGRFTTVTVAGQDTKRWFVEDFTLAEIKQLDNGAWFDARFTGRQVLTFQEVVDFVNGRVGLFPELKNPARLRSRGFDLEGAVAAALVKNRLVEATVNGRPAVQLQVFEADSLERLTRLLPTMRRHFLIGTPEGANRYLSAEGLKEVTEFATGVSPSKNLVHDDPALVTRAHAAGLTVVPYTFMMRPAADLYKDVPPEYRRMVDTAMRGLPDTRDALAADMKKFVDVYRVDGLFTDNPDLFPRPGSSSR